MATRNGASTLPKVLAAYCTLTPPAQGWELLIADNGSTDGTAALIASYAERLPLRYLHVPKAGKNVALNALLELALENRAAELLVFTDDDAMPKPDWLAQLAAAALAQPGATMFGGSIVPDWGAAPPDWVLRLVPLGLTFGITAPGLPDGPIFPGLIWGANMALRRHIFDSGYRFDEGVGPNGGSYAMGSETQLTRMLHDEGHQAWFCGAAQVVHHIRPRQLEQQQILQRAWRFGRGTFRHDKLGPYPYLFGVPRWMLSQYLGNLLSLGKTYLNRDLDQRFLKRWELSHTRGYCYEAWRVAAPQPARVLITGHCGALGGMELRMAQEAQFLTDGGYHSTLAPRRFPGSAAWSGQLRATGLNVAELNVAPFFEHWPWRRLNRWRAMLWDGAALRHHRADLVHVAFCWTSYGASALWLAQRQGLPTVISVHNAFPLEQFSTWHTPLLHQAFRSLRGIYAVSDSALQHFLANYAAYLPAGVRLAVIPNCVDTERFAPSAARALAARQRWQLPEDALVLGSVARLAEQKRPASAITLLAELRREFPTLYLVLVGSGPLEAALRRQAEALGVASHVIFTGFHANVADLLPAFDVHILLSRNEGFGIATIEAMACAVPAVGTDVPGNADVLRDSAGGMLVPLDNAAATVSALAALLRDPARRARMGQAGRAEVSQRYSVERVRGLVHDFYRGLV